MTHEELMMLHLEKTVPGPHAAFRHLKRNARVRFEGDSVTFHQWKHFNIGAHREVAGSCGVQALPPESFSRECPGTQDTPLGQVMLGKQAALGESWCGVQGLRSWEDRENSMQVPVGYEQKLEELGRGAVSGRHFPAGAGQECGGVGTGDEGQVQTTFYMAKMGLAAVPTSSPVALMPGTRGRPRSCLWRMERPGQGEVKPLSQGP